LNDAQSAQFKKALGSCIDIVRRIVRFSEAFPEQLLMKLRQRWPFELTSSPSGNCTILGRVIFCVK
jgi:hypothetical protein